MIQQKESESKNMENNQQQTLAAYLSGFDQPERARVTG